MADDNPGRRPPASDIFALDHEIDWEDLGGGVRRKLLTWNDSVMMARIAFEAGAVGTAHSHPHVQCSYVESGEFVLTIDGRSQTLRAGDGFLVPSDRVHDARAVTAGVLVDVFSPLREDFL